MMSLAFLFFSEIEAGNFLHLLTDLLCLCLGVFGSVHSFCCLTFKLFCSHAFCNGSYCTRFKEFSVKICVAVLERMFGNKTFKTEKKPQSVQTIKLSKNGKNTSKLISNCYL